MKYIQEIRVKNWLKNIFVFCPIVFSLELFNINKLGQTIVLAFAFCLVSSAVYVFNDINDVENDRKHLVKMNRPVASGDISITNAWILAGVLVLCGVCISVAVNYTSSLLLFLYILINLLYSKWLKKLPLIDCFCIAAGFVLRVLVGGTVVSLGVSEWMFLTVVALSLFMAFGKRRGELNNYSKGETRGVLSSYEMKFLDGTVFMCATLTMVFYSLWSISQESKMVYAVPLVMFAVMRYLLLVFTEHSEADPTTLIISDKTFCITCGIYVVIILMLLYIPGSV